MGQVWLPESLNNWILTKILEIFEGEMPKELIPEHRFIEQNPTMRSDFLEKVRARLITVQRTEIDGFTETGLALPGGKTLDVDVIISATGYHQLDLPFLPADAVRDDSTPPHAADMYKLMMPLRHRNLFLLGFVELFGPLPPAVEAQARYAAALLSGRVPRPDDAEMAAEVRKMHARQARAYIHSQRHALTMPGIPYVDDVLAPLGAVPTFGRMLGRLFTGNPIRRLQVLTAVWFAVPSSAQWRLCGHGAKQELATATVLRIAGKNETLSKREVELLAKAKVTA